VNDVLLETAEHALRQGQRGHALDALLEAWRAHRHPALAELITDVGRDAAQDLPPIQGRTRADFQDQWLDIANQRRAVDVPRLLERFRHPPWTMLPERLDRLIGLPDDPRIGVALAQFVLDMPVFSSVADSAWRALAQLIGRTSDVRCRPLLEQRLAMRDSFGVSDELTIRPAIEKVLAELKNPEPIDLGLLAATRAALEALRSSGPRPTAATIAPAPGPKSEAELLAAVWSEPHDDGPRRVYADWLLAQGEPRGEFISTQLALSSGATLTAKQRTAERKTLKANLRAWLGPLEPAVDRATVRFERGFLAAARPAFRTERAASELASHAAWGTVRELIGYHDSLSPLLERNALLGLERIELELGVVSVEALGRRTLPLPRLATLSLALASDVPRLAGLTTLTALVELRVLSAIEDHAEALVDSALGRKLERLHVEDRAADLARWLPFVRELPALKTLSLRRDLSGQRLVLLHRTTTGVALELRGITHAAEIERVLSPLAGRVERAELALDARFEPLLRELAQRLPRMSLSRVAAPDA
jgi:uncharacterized protein (TIGR02996 family)